MADDIPLGGDSSSDPQGINTTYFGYEGDPYGDTKSLNGIGNHDNLMQAGYSVALNKSAASKFGVELGQEFNYQGKKYRYDDSVPEIYQDARMDIYAGRHGGEGKIDRGNTGLGREWDLEQAAERRTAQGAGDDPFSAESMMAKLREAYPDSYKDRDNNELWESFSKKYPTPLSQIKAIYPQYAAAGVTDDQLIDKIGQKYFPSSDPGDVRDKIDPPQGIAGITHNLVKGVAEFAKYAASELVPQSKLQLDTLQRGYSQMVSSSSFQNADKGIAALYPDLDPVAQTGILSGYLAMPADSRRQAIDAATYDGDSKSEAGKRLDTAIGGASGGSGVLASSLDQMTREQQAIQDRSQLTADIKKTQLENPDDPKLGHTWSTMSKAGAAAPVGMVLSLIPGVREASNFAQLYDQNREAIAAKNPKMADAELDQKSTSAAMQQLPMFEVASLLKIGAGSFISKGITNRALRAGANMAVTIGGVSGSMTTQQVMQNMAAGDPTWQGVPEAAIGGATMGAFAIGAHSMMTLPELLMSKGATPKQAVASAMAYQGTHEKAALVDQHEGTLLLHNIQGQGVDAFEQTLLNSPSGRAATGVATHALEMSEEQAKDFLRGNPNKIDEVNRAAAVDMFIGALDGSKKITDKFNPSTREAYQSAIAAQVKGEYGEAKDHLQAVLSSMPDEDKTELGRLLRKNLLNTSGPITAPERQLPAPRFIVTPKQPREFTMVAPPAHEGTIYAPGPKPRLSLEDTKQQVIDDQFFTGESDGEEAMARVYDPDAALAKRRGQSGAMISPLDVAEAATSPLPAIRQAVTDSKLGRAGDYIKSVFAPGELNEATRTTQAIVRSRQAVRDMENTRNMDSYFRQQDTKDGMEFSIHADRRDNFWNQFSKQKQLQMLMAHEENRVTGNRKADRLNSIYKSKNRALAKLDQQRGSGYPLKESYIYHAVADEKEFAKVERVVRGQGIDPDFMHPRDVPTIRDLVKLGVKLKTNNRERLEAMRNFASYNAHMKMGALEDLKEAGLAFYSDLLDGMPKSEREQLEAQTTEFRSPLGRYRVQNDAANYLDRMWKAGILETSPGGKIINWGLDKLITIKAKTVSVILSLSGFHHLHQLGIGGALSLTAETRNLLSPDATLKSQALASTRALTDVASQGLFTHVKAPIQENKVLKFYKKQVMFKDLSEAQKTEVRHQLEGGLLPYVDHERQQQFIHKWFSKIPRVMGANDTVMDLGYKIATKASYQRFLFETLIPSMQMYEYNKQAAELFRNRPELLQPENRIERVKELSRIGKFVEGITGEGAMRNTDLPKVMKTVGQATLLSMSWKMAFIKTYGRAFASLANNAAHMDEVIQTLKKEGTKAAANRVLTNDVLYAAYYTGFSMMGAAIISSLIGTGVHSLQDLFYPNVGKDKQGNLIRVKPPFFTSEIPAIIHEGDNAFIGNSMQPMFQTLLQLHANRDYRGTEIRDPLAPLAEQAQSTLVYVLKQVAPISIQNLLASGGDERKAILGFAGLPTSAKWTTRHPIDDLIMGEYAREHGGGTKSEESQEKIDARHTYKQALLDKDPVAAEKAKQHMVALGVKPQGIKLAARNLNLTDGKEYFHLIDEKKQVEILRGMKPDERVEYLPHASKSAQARFKHEPK